MNILKSLNIYIYKLIKYKKYLQKHFLIHYHKRIIPNYNIITKYL